MKPSNDTTLYVYDGNGCAADQQNNTAVWDANFKGVWHLPNGTTLSASDSTINAKNGTIVGASAAVGQVDGAANVNGSQYITVGDLGLGTTFTLSAWINPAQSFQYGALIAQGSGGIEFRIDYGNSISLVKQGLFTLCTSSQTITTGSFHHVAASYDGSTCSFYIDGAAAGSASVATTFSSGSYDIGRAGTGQFFNGLIDEVRASNIVRPSGWIATEFRNQSAPGTFLSVGAQEAP